MPFKVQTTVRRASLGERPCCTCFRPFLPWGRQTKFCCRDCDTSRRAWTQLELEALVALHDAGFYLHEIAERIHRPFGSVKVKAWELQRGRLLRSRQGESAWRRRMAEARLAAAA